MKKAVGIVQVSEENVKLMSEMDPLEVCVIVGDEYTSHIVMRTASKLNFEVIDLTDMREDSSWTVGSKEVKVKPYEGNSITIKLK